MSDITYKPVLSAANFFFSEAFASLIVGPVGSTKTSASLLKIAHHAKRMAPCIDGVRRSRCIWVRNTREQLRDTSIRDFLQWYPDGDLCTFHKTDYAALLKFDDVECEVWFRGLDEPQDVRRLLSVQASFAVFDEFREISPAIYDAMQTRLGRYPSKLMVPPRPEWGVDEKGLPVGGCVTDDGKPNKHVWGASNPPDADTYWEGVLTAPPSNTFVSIQPSGMSAEADWLMYLPTNYYEDMIQGKSEDWVDVYVHGKFGKSLSGTPVVKTFKADLHTAGSTLAIMVMSPLLIGADAGLTPAAVCGQLDHTSRLMVQAEAAGVGMGALRFCREKLKPLLATRFPQCQPLIVIDPTAFRRGDTDERSVADIYRREGFRIIPARTNNITARLAAMDSYFTRLVDGKPAIQIDPSAQLLLQALGGRYRYKINTKGETDDSPEKSHPWSDLCLAEGTPVLTPGGYVRIEALRAGDTVCVADGLDTVVATSSRVADTITVGLSDGSELTCTPDHPFAVQSNSHTCFIPADMLTSDHVIVSVEDGKWASGASRTPQSEASSVSAGSAGVSSTPLRGVWRRAKGAIARSSATVSGAVSKVVSRLMGCGSPRAGETGTIGINGLTNAWYHCTGTCGRSTTDQYQQDTTSITSTTTRPTTTSLTSNSLPQNSTAESTSRSVSPAEHLTHKPPSQRQEKRQRSGTDRMPDENGTGRMRYPTGLSVESKRSAGPNRVYNLQTERTHTYYAGSALVHNCDSLQYLCLHAGGGVEAGVVLQATVRTIEEEVSAAGWT